MSWEDARRILCVRLDGVGDVLMTTPALRALKPRRLTLLTSPAGAEAADCVPEVDDVWAYASPWMKSSGPGDALGDLRMVERMRAARFDAAVIFTVYTQSPLPAALLCHLAGIPLRLAHCRENPYGLLTDWAAESEPERGVRHEVRRQLDLVATVGGRTEDERLSLTVPPDALARADRVLRERGIEPDSPWILVHPGATAPSRRYPPESFAEAATRLGRRTGLPILLSGSRQEAALIEDIRSTMRGPAVSLAGLLDFPSLAALIGRARLLISNNTGPAHIAAAVGTPVVDLYALTNPQHTPWGVPCRVLFHDVPCRFCYKSVCPQIHHHCLRLVRPAQVVEAAWELLEETRGGALLAHPGDVLK